jgi:hypothetical protein
MPVLYVPLREHVFTGTCSELASISDLLAHKSEHQRSHTASSTGTEGGGYQLSTKAECRFSQSQSRGTNLSDGHSQAQLACLDTWDSSFCRAEVDIRNSFSRRRQGVSRIDQLKGQAGVEGRDPTQVAIQVTKPGTQFFRICTREEEEEAIPQPCEEPADWYLSNGTAEDTLVRQCAASSEGQKATCGEGGEQREGDELLTEGQVTIPDVANRQDHFRKSGKGKGQGHKIQARMLEEPHQRVPASCIEPVPHKDEAECTHSELTAPQKGEELGSCMHNPPGILPNSQVFAFNSCKGDATHASVGIPTHKIPEADEKTAKLHCNDLDDANPPNHPGIPSQQLTASTLLVLAGLLYDHFTQAAFGDTFHRVNKCSSRDQWLSIFQSESIAVQRSYFSQSSGMQQLLLTRASRADGIS